MNNFNTSLATDGTYLYLCVGTNNKSGMYKIGSGQGQTIAGKVYNFT